ncbi:unnamed protein product [marine sediment metagenome]|uniref:Uncharacterized protein n=1 Tax=marine sediment metagenome TaxID=412755 RepID=X1LFX8_9ZZZZ
MSKRWPVKGIEAPGFYENKIDGIRESLAGVAVKVAAVEEKVLADRYMTDDEKAVPSPAGRSPNGTSGPGSGLWHFVQGLPPS